MFRKRSLVVGVLVVLAMVGVSAAVVATRDDGGTSAARPVSIETLQLAASNTEASESMQFELRSSGELGLRASGVVSGDGHTGTVSVDLGDLGHVEQRIVDGTVYIDAGGLFGGSDGKWIALPLDGLGDAGTSIPGLNGTPKSALDLLRDVAGPVETIGDDTVAGHHATHYRATVSEGGDASIDVWIDDQDRVVKIQSTSPDGGADITFEVTAFGVPVDVTAPPADDVMELPGLGRAGTSGEGSSGII
ncbi:MAG TPA: hypothetical protein VFZ17_02330 [Acidimicrobiia bacterium]|nr:hypothetical protein [Acidimicrobiia bacterium]